MFYIYNIKKRIIPCSSEHGNMESWQSGLSRLFAKQVNQKVTGVRIPCFPQAFRMDEAEVVIKKAM